MSDWFILGHGCGRGKKEMFCHVVVASVWLLHWTELLFWMIYKLVDWGYFQWPNFSEFNDGPLLSTSADQAQTDCTSGLCTWHWNSAFKRSAAGTASLEKPKVPNSFSKVSCTCVVSDNTVLCSFLFSVQCKVSDKNLKWECDRGKKKSVTDMAMRSIMWMQLLSF